MAKKKKTQEKKIEMEEQTPQAENETVENAEQQVSEDEVEEIIVKEEEVEALQKELEEARNQANEYLDGWQRSRAEFANYKKRIEREQQQLYQTTAGNILKRYLEILDDLERALKNRPQEGYGAEWAEGIELVYRKLVNILESEGVKSMETEGQIFDPTLHEAVTSEDSDDHESGEIIEVLQRGYMLGDKVLRPAVVRVAK